MKIFGGENRRNNDQVNQRPSINNGTDRCKIVVLSKRWIRQTLNLFTNKVLLTARHIKRKDILLIFCSYFARHYFAIQIV